MPKAKQEDLRWLIIYQTIVLQRTKNEISLNLDISEKTVSRIRKLFRETGDILPIEHGRGREFILDEEKTNLLRLLAIQQPDWFLDEFQTLIALIYGVTPSISTICRTFERIGYTRKQLSFIAKQRDPIQRAHYSILASLYHRNQFLFWDESGRNNGTIKRKFGRAQKGEKAVKEDNYQPRGGKLNFLASMDFYGIVDLVIWKGNCNSEVCEYAVNQVVIPYLNPFPGNRSVVVMDNANFHTTVIVNAIEATGAIVLWLPVYSPGNSINYLMKFTDFNPIEAVFGIIKDWLKRNREIAEICPRIAIILAAASVTRQDARNFFRYCGYVP